MSLDPTRRFADRVEMYVRYRPGYPPEIIGLLRSQCGLEPGHEIADLGGIEFGNLRQSGFDDFGADAVRPLGLE